MGHVNLETTVSKFADIIEGVVPGLLAEAKHGFDRQEIAQQLRCLRPLTDRYLTHPVLDTLIDENLTDITGVPALRAIETMLYFGVLNVYTFVFNKARHLIREISPNKVSKHWFPDSFDPNKALQAIGDHPFLDEEDIKGTFFQCYLAEIEPLRETRYKQDDTVLFFNSVYLSGVLLGIYADLAVLTYAQRQEAHQTRPTGKGLREDPVARARRLAERTDEWLSGGDWLSCGDLQEPYTVFREAAAIFENQGDKDGLMTCLAYQAMILQHWERLDEALEVQREVQQLALELEETEKLAGSLAISLGIKAMMAEQRGHTEEAKRLFREQAQISSQVLGEAGVALGLISEATLLRNAGELGKACELAEKAVQLAKRSGVTEVEEQCRKTMDSIRDRMG